MKKSIFLFFVIVLFFGCQKSQDVEFDVFKKAIEENERIAFLYENRKGAAYNGFNIIELYQNKKNKFPINHYRQRQQELSNFDPKRLSEYNQEAVKSVATFLQNKIRILEKSKHGDSTFFSVISILKNETENEDQTNEEQFDNIIFNLEKIPHYFELAKKVIKNPNQEKIKLAVEAYSNDYFYLKNELPTLIRKPDILKENQIDFSQKNETAQIAIKDFIAYLNSHLFELRSRTTTL